MEEEIWVRALFNDEIYSHIISTGLMDIPFEKQNIKYSHLEVGQRRTQSKTA